MKIVSWPSGGGEADSHQQLPLGLPLALRIVSLICATASGESARSCQWRPRSRGSQGAKPCMWKIGIRETIQGPLDDPRRPREFRLTYSENQNYKSAHPAS